MLSFASFARTSCLGGREGGRACYLYNLWPLLFSVCPLSVKEILNPAEPSHHSEADRFSQLVVTASWHHLGFDKAPSPQLQINNESPPLFCPLFFFFLHSRVWSDLLAHFASLLQFSGSRRFFQTCIYPGRVGSSEQVRELHHNISDWSTRTALSV